MTVDSTADLVAQYVEPFYLQMMRTNAIEDGAVLAPAIAAVGKSARPDQVVRLLRYAWRERVMGAWMALLQDSPSVNEAVLEALATSHGSLDSPPLATAAVVLTGSGSLDALATYYAADRAAGWGASGIIAAAAEYVHEQHDAPNPIAAPTAEDRETFANLLDVARQLREA